MAFLTAAATCLSLLLLLAAAWRDLATRLIPDGVSLGLAALGLFLRAADGPAALGASVAVAGLLFLALLPLHARGAVGGGDVKLAAALALGLPPLATLDFLLATALSGGVLGLAYLALARLPAGRACPAGAAAALPRRVLAVERRRISRGGPLPYAVAIAVGGAATLLAPAGG